MSEIKLPDCPLCEGAVDLNATEGDDRIIYCSQCGVSLLDDMNWEDEGYNADENIIKKWSTRPIEAKLKLEIQKLKRALEKQKTRPQND